VIVAARPSARYIRWSFRPAWPARCRDEAEEISMAEWLVPIALFWTLAALYLGGFPIRIEESSGLKQFLGLLLTFALYLVVWWAVRMGIQSALPAIASVIVATLVASVLIPVLSRVAFRVFGVRITGASHAHG
jgi:hypothetical protein